MKTLLNTIRGFFSWNLSIQGSLFPQKKSPRNFSPRIESVYEISYDSEKPAPARLVDIFVNGESVLTSLNAKALYLDFQSQAAEQNLIRSELEEEAASGKPLSTDAVTKLRSDVESQRLLAHRQIQSLRRARTRVS